MKATAKALTQINAALAAYDGDKAEALAFIESLSGDGITYKKFCGAVARASAKLSVRISFSKDVWTEAQSLVNQHGLNADNVVSAIDTHIRDINRDKGNFRATNFSALDILAALTKYVETKSASRAVKPHIVSTVMRGGVEQKVWNDGHTGERTTQ